MNVVKIGAGVLAAVVVLFLGAVAMQPGHSHIERSKVVQAEPKDVYPFAADMKKWQSWSPWAEMDPNQKVTFSENPAGVGAWYTWEGEVTGQGKMTVAAAKEPESVEHDLEFIKPFTAKARVKFEMKPEGNGTKVTWGYDADNDFMAKAFGLFMDMDTMLGGDFEKGLNKLAPLVEAAAKTRREAEAAAAAKAAQEAAAAAAAAAEAAKTAAEAATAAANALGGTPAAPQ